MDVGVMNGGEWGREGGWEDKFSGKIFVMKEILCTFACGKRKGTVVLGAFCGINLMIKIY